MIPRFFIDRPIFAAVLSIVITLLGGIFLAGLPVAQYPQIAPPTVMVQCAYPGASAEVVAETVAAPIEQQVNGVEGMMYMSSQCTNDGNYSLTVTFRPGIDLNFAQVLVQNRVSLATPMLPDVVKAAGVTTRKRSPDILLLVSLNSTDARYDQLYLSNFATIQVKDELARVEGVGDVIIFGAQDYSLRVWVDPERLAARGVTAGDVVRAVRENNTPVAAGQLGQPPAADRAFQYPIAVLGRLAEPEQFAQIAVKSTPDGRVIRLRDVGRAELGAKNRDIVSRLDGKPCANIAVFSLPDANALDTADRIRARMEELKQAFPEGVRYDIVYDTTPVVRESIHEVFKSLRDAVVLVSIVVLVFLQNWRSTLIPLVAVPVAVVGTFPALALFGFSLNNLTLFGLVLAIGIVVDDAIVVVEAVEHHIERGLSPRDATVRAMDEVSGPVIAVGLVLSAVFVPCAFITGIVGEFFRQFALTIAVSTLISALNSLTLSPALCAILLRPAVPGRRRNVLPPLGVAAAGGVAAAWFLAPAAEAWLGDSLARWAGGAATYWGVRAALAAAGVAAGLLLSRAVNRLLRLGLGLFNAAFRAGTGAYTRLVGLGLRLSVLVLLAYAGLVGLTGYGLTALPTGYIPSQDQGYLFVSIQLPDASSLERTRKVVEQVDAICHDTKGVAHTISISGQSFVLGAYGSNFGQMFVILDDFHHRESPRLHSDAIANGLRQRITAEVPEAQVAIFGPPPVKGLGTGGGYKFIVEDRGDLGLQTLQEQSQNLIDRANGEPGLMGVFTVFRADSPQLFVDVDRDQCARLGVQLADVFATLQVYLGSLYANDVNRFGRTWQVIVQSEGRFRNQVEDVRRLRVRNAAGQMVPLGALVEVRRTNGPLLLTRYNMYPAASVNGMAAPGVSSGEAIRAVQRLADRELPGNMALEWTEISYLQLQAGNTALLIFALAVVGVFLVLAALYESWSLPLAVILVVPMCLLGSLAGVALTGSDINIFTQVGFVVLVGLASKNAILIVEFAKLKREQGVPRREATLQASGLRLRPILMTSLAFILGVAPLVFSTGAGAEMRRTLGTAVFSGMLGVTLFGIFLTPVFFFVINWLSEAAPLSSPRTRLAAVVIICTAGLASLALAGALLFWCWSEGVLSPAGALALSAGLVLVVLFVAVRQLERAGRLAARRGALGRMWRRVLRRAARPGADGPARNGHARPAGSAGDGDGDAARFRAGPPPAGDGRPGGDGHIEERD